MKVTFQFDNGNSVLILTPENQRDKTYISLCIDGKNDVKIKPCKDECLKLEFKSYERLEKLGECGEQA